MKLTKRNSLISTVILIAILLSGVTGYDYAHATLSSNNSAVASQFSCEQPNSILVTEDNAVTPNYYAISTSSTPTTPCGTLLYGGSINAGGVAGTNPTLVLQSAVNLVETYAQGGTVSTQGLINSSLLLITTSKVTLISDNTATGTGTKNLILMNLTLTSGTSAILNTYIANCRIFSLYLHASTNQITDTVFNNDAFIRQKSSQGIFVTGTGNFVNYVTFYNPIMLDSAPTVSGHGMITFNNTHSGNGQFAMYAPQWTSTGTQTFTFLQVNGIIQEAFAFTSGSFNAGTTNNHFTGVNIAATGSFQELKFIGNEFEMHGTSTLTNIANGVPHASISFIDNTICICSTNLRQYLLNNSNTYANWSQPSSYTFTGNDFTAQATTSVSYTPGVQGANWQVSIQNNPGLINPTQSVQSVRVLSPQTDGANSPVSTTLTMPLVANTNYNFYALFACTNAASSTLNFQITTISGATLVRAIATGGAGGSTAIFATNILGSSSSSAGVQEVIAGTITMGSTPGTLEIDFINPAAVGTTTILAGSFLWVWQVQ